MITEKELVSVLKLDKVGCVRVLTALEMEDVEDALEAINGVLNGDGVESLNPSDSQYGPDLLYVSRGESYAPTVCFDAELVDFFVGSWGDWLEEWEAIERRAQEEEDSEPDEEDILTDDGCTFRYLGKVIVSEDDAEDARIALLDWMESNGFYPNVWFMSDHGNAHALNF